MPKHNFKELNIWKKARQLVVDVYKLSKGFPENEKFGITMQLRRAAVSISCNISEGAGRSTNRDFSHFLDMAYSSGNESINLIILSMDLGYLKNGEKTIEDLNELCKMIRGLQKTLK